MAAGVLLTIGHADPAPPGGPGDRAVRRRGAVPGGDAWFRAALGIGSPWARLATAVFALAATALGATVAVEAQLAVLLAALVLMLAGERYAAWRGPLVGLRQRRAGGWEA